MQQEKDRLAAINQIFFQFRHVDIFCYADVAH